MPLVATVQAYGTCCTAVLLFQRCLLTMQVRVLRDKTPQEAAQQVQRWRPNLLYLCSGAGPGATLPPLRLSPSSASAAVASSNGDVGKHAAAVPSVAAGNGKASVLCVRLTAGDASQGGERGATR